MAGPRSLQITDSLVAKHVDVKLKHQKSDKGGAASTLTHGVRGCSFPEWKSAGKRPEREEELYRAAMQVYCDMETGWLYEHVEAYQWPKVVQYVNLYDMDATYVAGP